MTIRAKCPECHCIEGHVMDERFVSNDTWEGGWDPDRTSALFFTCPCGHSFPAMWWEQKTPKSLNCNLVDAATGEPMCEEFFKGLWFEKTAPCP